LPALSRNSTLLDRLGKIAYYSPRLEIQQGSLYPALYRLEHQDFIASEWGELENKRKAKYYRLSAVGRRHLQQEALNWNRMADIIAGIFNTAPEEL